MTAMIKTNAGPIEGEIEILPPKAESMHAEMQAAQEQFLQVTGFARKTVEHVWRMGEALSKAKELHKSLKKRIGKSQPKWESILKQYDISVPSDNRARRLYDGCPNLELLEGKTIMEAYELAGITKAVNAKKEIATSAESNSETKPIPIVLTDDNAAAADADDEWPDVAESDLKDGDDHDPAEEAIFDEPDTEEDSSELNLNDPNDSSEDVVDHLKSLINDVKTVRTDDLMDEQVEDALVQIETIAEMVIQMKLALEARLTAHAAV